MILGTFICWLLLCMLSKNLFELILRTAIGGTIFILIVLKVFGVY